MFTTEQQPNQASDIDALLSSFKRDPIVTNVIPAQTGNITGAAQEFPTEEVDEDDEASTLVEETQSTTEEDAGEETEEQPSTEFVAEFEKTFGIKPEEAVELVNSLQAFRDEQRLMRQWSVSPTEYDNRMAQVKTFYDTLPEEGREKFNTVEGADAIWNHLQNIGKATTSNKSTKSTANGKSRGTRTPAPTKPAYDFKKSDILTMPAEEYRKKLPLITRAFQTGRVLEDA